jgi:2-C-methyl-D-erythritol 4-phosphate cytidylyltransferase
MATIEKASRLARLFGGRDHYTAAIILAGGSGNRMDSKTTKQMMMLDGKPIIVHSLEAFQASDYIDEIIVVAKADEIDLYAPLFEQYGITKATKVVEGGATRQESVLKGFEAIPDRADHIAIHDGARPLITPTQIKSVVLAAYDYKAAAAAAPAKDSVKVANISGMIDYTVDRKTVWLMQTPQVFYGNLFRASIYTAAKNKFEGTDDTQVVEHAGFSTKLVNTGYENIKITTPVDLLIAEAILKQRKEEKSDD